uniref:CSON013142 protein n=1 Tax=Culicoides sonorensis TaxID=179676 RepID=A0A336MBG8_CULSO
MKAVFLLVALLVAVVCVKAQGMPNLPAELQGEAEQLRNEISQLPKTEAGFPDISQASDDLRARMDDFMARMRAAQA